MKCEKHQVSWHLQLRNSSSFIPDSKESVAPQPNQQIWSFQKVLSFPVSSNHSKCILLSSIHQHILSAMCCWSEELPSKCPKYHSSSCKSPLRNHQNDLWPTARAHSHGGSMGMIKGKGQHHDASWCIMHLVITILNYTNLRQAALHASHPTHLTFQNSSDSFSGWKPIAQPTSQPKCGSKTC